MDIRTALITGASSGIGSALAAALARPDTTLHLSGRHAVRLEAVAGVCRERGAVVRQAVLDVREREAMTAWITSAGPFDLVVANAGVSPATIGGTIEGPEPVREIFATNLDGVLNTVLPAMVVMAEQPADADGVRGRIAAIASIAAFAPTQWAPAYCASKAAVDAWIVGTRAAARRSGVVLTSVCPGYVRTPMTAGNRFLMPGLMDAERAARIILHGVAAGRSRLVFPRWMGLAARAAALLPVSLMAAVADRR